MKKSITILFIQLFFTLSLSAQFFSGYYVSDPPQAEFEHLKIHHHHSKHHKYEGDLSVKGFTDYGELWELQAVMISGYKAANFINKFANEIDVQTVYEFKIAIDGIEEDFILMGYEDENGHPAFRAIEEIFKSAKEEALVEIKTFDLVKAHHLH